MTGADAPLDVHLGRLEAFLRETCPDLTWQSIALVDEPLPGPQATMSSHRLTPDAFAPTWQAVVTESARDWVNLHALGVDDNVLVVSVEHMSAPPDADSPREARQVSVNLSGPERG